MQAVAEANGWHGWGFDNNTLCPENQVSTVQHLVCEPEYPHNVDATFHSWTGITCTPSGGALCLSLPGWGLTGNVSAIAALTPLTELQMVNLANNSLTGTHAVLNCILVFYAVGVRMHMSLLRNAAACTGNHSMLAAGQLPESHSIQSEVPSEDVEVEIAHSLAVIYLSNNSISGSLPPRWGDRDIGWKWTLQRLYLSDNQLTGELPVLWSEGNVLSQLGRIDLFHNNLTGPIPWSRDNMSSLENLVLLPGVNAAIFCLEIVLHIHQLRCDWCHRHFHVQATQLLHGMYANDASTGWHDLNKPVNMPHDQSHFILRSADACHPYAGNNFCGPIPQDFEGAVRNFTGRQGDQEVLEKVANFDRICVGSQQAGSASHNGFIGKKPAQSHFDAADVDTDVQ